MDKTPAETPPTQRALQVLHALANHTRRTGHPPTIRELAQALCLASSQGVYDHIRRLQARGLVTRPPRGQARGLQLTPAGWAALGAAPPEGGTDPDGLAEVLRLVAEERARQHAKWGQQEREVELVQLAALCVQWIQAIRRRRAARAEPAEARGLVERLACKFCREPVEADPQVLQAHLAHCRLAPAEVRKAWRPR